MPAITNYINRREVFEPEVISVMANAYELALESFQPPAPQSVRECIAACIIGMARAGERDPRKLCEKALVAQSVVIERERSGLESRVE